MQDMEGRSTYKERRKQTDRPTTDNAFVTLEEHEASRQLAHRQSSYISMRSDDEGATSRGSTPPPEYVNKSETLNRQRGAAPSYQCVTGIEGCICTCGCSC